MGSAHDARFEELASEPDDRIDVALGAALIARDVHPNLDVRGVVASLDELAAPLVARGLSGRPLRAQAEELARHVYERCGFKGNESDYYDPRNSLISDVLERRLGIPITLAVVYCEVARRAGVLARGVSFPGHFLVRLDAPAGGEPPVFVDPFFGGRVLDEEGLRGLYRRVTGREEAVSAELLAPASPRSVLHRMLVNLRAVYLSRGDMARAMLTIDRILCLAPDAAEPLRERGLLSARLGATEAALADLERFLAVAPASAEAPQIRARIAELKERAKTRALN